MAYSSEDVLVLAKAGFTAEQIAALNIVGTAPEPVPAPEPAPAPAAPEPAPAPAPEPTPAQGATVDDVLKAINGLTTTFQNGFLQGATQPAPVTAEQVLAEIINPPQKPTT